MKKALLLALLALIPAALRAQSGTHIVQVNWSPAADGSDAGGTINVYRAVGACPASGISGLTFSKIATNVALTSSATSSTGSYTDSGLNAGVYCYYVTAVVNTAESNPSTTAGATAKPNAPTGFTVTIQ